MISEDDAKTLIDQHLTSSGWDIADFNTIRKNWSISSGRDKMYTLIPAFHRNAKIITI